MSHNSIPITIITGYLGSGKTTFLRHLVKSADKKIAILMNEFGEIAIDSKVVKGKNIEMAELSGGCVCCSLAGEFEAAIAEILEKVHPQWIIVETTGVAEPSALAQDVLENIAGVKLDAIITIADADALIRFPNIGHTGREQIELADLIILNKTDCISSEQSEALKDKLKDINNRASIIESEFCTIDAKLIFGLEHSRAIVSHKAHNPAMEYFTFENNSKKADYEKFVKFLESLPRQIYRAKGFVKTNQGTYLMNYVAQRYTFEEFEYQRTELVFIGHLIENQEKNIKVKLEDLFS
ncbi:GTP-binding protein [Candidatus Micrarchaeota archaeon]|nr:GTP-binding protein [Candidatus Micrarchaeota archaeon]